MMRALRVTMIVLGICLGLGAVTVGGDPPIVAEEAKLTAFDGEANDGFGVAVSIDEDTALIGAQWEDEIASVSGAAYVFERDGTHWGHAIKLKASDAESGDVFGCAVALSEDTALVGAFGDDDNGFGSGSAYVFVRSGTTWIEQAKLNPSDARADQGFGATVALSGDTAVIGVQDSIFIVGSAYVFVRDGTTWTEQAILSADDILEGNGFGSAVAVWEDTAVVGARGDNENGPSAGAAYVYERDGTRWLEPTKLTPSDAVPLDSFGYSVSIEGETALIGAYTDRDSGIVTGAAYVYSHDGASWTEEAQLKASDGEDGDRFGGSVSLSGDRALVGAWRDDNPLPGAGSAYLFERSASSWTECVKLTASDTAAGDMFGASVSLSQGAGLIGAHEDDDQGFDSGSAYLYRILPTAIYCTAKTNSLGCVPQIAYQGVPSATGEAGFVVAVRNVLSQKAGLLFYGTEGGAAAPFQGGLLCVGAPLFRTPARAAGGIPPPPQNCTGVIRLDMNTFAAGKLGGTPNSALRSVGTVVHCQWWLRDGQATFGSSLSDALEYTIGP